MYDREHAEKIIKVILGEALEHLLEARELLEKASDAIGGTRDSVISYLTVDSYFYEAGVHVSKAYMKVGGSDSVIIAELFEPMLASVNTAMLYFQGCFHTWADGRPPCGLTPHAIMYIGLEIETAKGLIGQAYDIVNEKTMGLASALKEVEIIRFTSPG